MSLVNPSLRFATLNVKSAIADDVKFIISKYMQSQNLSLLAITESKIRLPVKTAQNWGNGASFVGIGTPPAVQQNIGGVGFVYREEYIKLVPNTLQLVSHRICAAEFSPAAGGPASFICVCIYAPTETHPLPAREQFYKSLSEFYRKLTAQHPSKFIYIAGDFNTDFGLDATAYNAADYVLGNAAPESSENANLVLGFCDQHNLVVANLKVRTSDRKRATWTHPRTGSTHVKDLVLVSRNCRKQLRKVVALRQVGVFDHKAVLWSLNPSHRCFQPQANTRPSTSLITPQPNIRNPSANVAKPGKP